MTLQGHRNVGGGGGEREREREIDGGTGLSPVEKSEEKRDLLGSWRRALMVLGALQCLGCGLEDAFFADCQGWVSQDLW